MRRLVMVAVALMPLFVACASPRALTKPLRTAPPRTSTSLPAFPHVFTVVMENQGYAASLRIPRIRALVNRYAFATSMYAVGHPSLPNYLALTAGSTFGVRSDCWFCYQDQPNIASQMEARGISWGAYLEGLPAAGDLIPYWPFTGYAAKHDPFVYYDAIRNSPRQRSHLQPLSRLMALLRGPAKRVPRYVWVTPNLCHDGHTCPPAQAARWLDGFVSKITASRAWKDGGVLFVLWDEAAGGDDRGLTPSGKIAPGIGGGHVLLIVISPALPHGLRISEPLDLVSLLKTEEEAFGLPLLGRAALPTTPDHQAFFRAPTRSLPAARLAGRLTGAMRPVPQRIAGGP